MSDKVRIFALGGLDEYGKNLYCVDINDDIFVFECGIKFPDKSTPGVNFIIAEICIIPYVAFPDFFQINL